MQKNYRAFLSSRVCRAILCHCIRTPSNNHYIELTTYSSLLRQDWGIATGRNPSGPLFPKGMLLSLVKPPQIQHWRLSWHPRTQHRKSNRYMIWTLALFKHIILSLLVKKNWIKSDSVGFFWVFLAIVPTMHISFCQCFWQYCWLLL